MAQSIDQLIISVSNEISINKGLFAIKKLGQSNAMGTTSMAYGAEKDGSIFPVEMTLNENDRWKTICYGIPARHIRADPL